MVRYRFALMIIVLIFLYAFSYGCAPATINKVQLQTMEFDKAPPFDLPIKLEKPEKPIPIFLDGDFNKTENIDNLEYFAFNKDEFIKIIHLSKMFDVQGEVIYLCVDIINEEIKTNNDLKELLGRKNSISQHFADLYINEQNLRLQENYQHEKENLINKVFLFIQSGIIIALVL